jgi:DNA modification methylase
MVAVFREVRRVMRDDAVCFCNMGDGYRDKQLLLMPARLALALQADGWWVRSDIIWAKPNPMPESCTDRCVSAHEHIFMLTKRARYFFDNDAIREPHTDGTHSRGNGGAKRGNSTDFRESGAAAKIGGWNDLPPTEHPGGRACRNVWTLPTESFSGAHFATFPRALAERCIKAGTSERGCCAACGAPWVRQVEKPKPPQEAFTARREPDDGMVQSGFRDGGVFRGSGQKLQNWLDANPARTTGWRASCSCFRPCTCHPSEAPVPCQHKYAFSECVAAATAGESAPNADVQPCTVLDPFSGAGTTLLVADRLQRHAIGIDLNASYADLARRRIEADAPLFTSWAPAEDPADQLMADLFAEAAE